MEGVILGWFVLVSTGSVLALAVFGSLQFLGTLISPLFGMAGDRIGNRNVLLPDAGRLPRPGEPA